MKAVSRDKTEWTKEGNLVVVVCLDVVVLCESAVLYDGMRKPFLLFPELYVSWYVEDCALLTEMKPF